MKFLSQIKCRYFGRFAALLCMLTLALMQSSCQAKSENWLEDVRAKIPDGKVVNLTLHGYNYTNRYIDEYSVDGNGGGNLPISGPSSGGGGSVCCFSHVQGTTEGKVKVRWQADACMYSLRSSDGSEVFDRTHSFYREVTVDVDPHVPDHPENFDVHFYPDGHVEAFITDTIGPRLELSKDREDRSEYPRCPNDKKPAK